MSAQSISPRYNSVVDGDGRNNVTAAEILAARDETILLGIDPGLSGALAFYNLQDGTVEIVDMPVVEVVRNGKTKREVNASLLADWIRVRKPAHAYLELVNAMPGQGVTSMFAFGKTTGIIKGVLATLAIPTTEVPPLKWQREMGVRGGKDAARLRASELFPNDAKFFARVKDDGRADAALIARWGSRQG